MGGNSERIHHLSAEDFSGQDHEGVCLTQWYHLRGKYKCVYFLYVVFGTFDVVYYRPHSPLCMSNLPILALCEQLLLISTSFI